MRDNKIVLPIEFSILGELNVYIAYDYTPEQAACTDPDNNPCPAIDEELDITSIEIPALCEGDFLYMVAHDDLAWLEDKIREKMA